MPVCAPVQSLALKLLGNFVEIKKVKFQTSRINHLAYIRGCRDWWRVNVGAGTITCNYDGVNKHKTIIEDDAGNRYAARSPYFELGVAHC